MLKVANVVWSFADDIIFHNPALVLFAHGCKWACPGCHNKALQCFESIETPKFSHSDDLMRFVFEAAVKYKFNHGLTIVGSGGDFFFQLDAWLAFCKKIKHLFPAIKLIWYTGAEYSDENLTKISDSLNDLDAVLWGKLRHKNGYVVKTLSLGENGHKTSKEIVTGEYNYKFEEQS